MIDLQFWCVGFPTNRFQEYTPNVFVDEDKLPLLSSSCSQKTWELALFLSARIIASAAVTVPPWRPFKRWSVWLKIFSLRQQQLKRALKVLMFVCAPMIEKMTWKMAQLSTLDIFYQNVNNMATILNNKISKILLLPNL